MNKKDKAPNQNGFEKGASANKFGKKTKQSNLGPGNFKDFESPEFIDYSEKLEKKNKKNKKNGENPKQHNNNFKQESSILDQKITWEDFKNKNPVVNLYESGKALVELSVQI